MSYISGYVTTRTRARYTPSSHISRMYASFPDNKKKTIDRNTLKLECKIVAADLILASSEVMSFSKVVFNLLDSFWNVPKSASPDQYWQYLIKLHSSHLVFSKYLAAMWNGGNGGASKQRQSAATWNVRNGGCEQFSFFFFWCGFVNRP